MTMRPNAAEGIVIIGGQTFQLSKPAASTVLLPAFDRYDALRDEIREFVKKAIESAETVSQMGLLETMESSPWSMIPTPPSFTSPSAMPMGRSTP